MFLFPDSFHWLFSNCPAKPGWWPSGRWVPDATCRGRLTEEQGLVDCWVWEQLLRTVAFVGPSGLPAIPILSSTPKRSPALSSISFPHLWLVSPYRKAKFSNSKRGGLGYPGYVYTWLLGEKSETPVKVPVEDKAGSAQNLTKSLSEPHTWLFRLKWDSLNWLLTSWQLRRLANKFLWFGLPILLKIYISLLHI